MASSLDVAKQTDIRAPEAVNSPDYQERHTGEIFGQGLSFSGNERDKLWFGGPGPSWADLSDLSGCDSPNDGRAVIAADFDDDGDSDLFVHNIQRERHGLYRNDAVLPGGAGRHFLSVRLAARAPWQHEAIGATVLVHGPAGPSAQVLSRGAGFVSGQPGELSFGLGELREARVEVRWPGGEREDFGALAADRRWLLRQGAGAGAELPLRPRPLPDAPPGGLVLREGDLVPPVRLLDAEGRERLVDVRALAGGKPLLVNFWASFCQPCVAELPLLAARHAEGEVRVVAVDVDLPGEHARARALLREAQADFPCFFAPGPGAEPPGADAPPGLEAWVDLERLAIPTTLVVSPDGRVEAVLRGPLGAPQAAAEPPGG